MADPELIGVLCRIVVPLRGPTRIGALTWAVWNGVLVPRALAAFGDRAAPALLAVVNEPDG